MPQRLLHQGGHLSLGCTYKAVARLKKLSHITRLTTGFRSDLRWWHLFATRWNGISFFNNSTPDYFISTDASGAWGYGAVFERQWMQLALSKEWAGMDIMAKELLPIVLSCAVWGHYTVRQQCPIQVR